LYFLMAERTLRCADPRKLEIYREATAMFARGVALRGDAAERVEIPYAMGARGGAMPAVFVKAAGDRPAPCIIHFNGFDWLKEFNYLSMAEEYARRGIAGLFCDQPGSGGALRLHGLPAEVESERSVGACMDYLARRRAQQRRAEARRPAARGRRRRALLGRQLPAHTRPRGRLDRRHARRPRPRVTSRATRRRVASVRRSARAASGCRALA